MAKIIELIYVEVTRGLGVDSDPVRRVEQYWTKEGKLLFEFDPCVNDKVHKRSLK